MRWSLFTVTLAISVISLASCNIGGNGPAMSSDTRPLKRPVTDEYYGVKVTEDYRWLENSEDPAVKQFVEEQNRRSRAYFDKLPVRSIILSRLKELNQGSASYSGLIQRGEEVFALKDQPPKN